MGPNVGGGLELPVVSRLILSLKMPINHHFHMLRLVLSCRKVTAQVTDPATSTIVAMASSTEPEFLFEFRAKQERFPRLRCLWDAKTAARVGEKLAFRLSEIGISGVHIDADDEILRPVHYRKKVLPFFDSVRRAGVEIHGAERLGEIGPVTGCQCLKTKGCV